MAGMGPAPKPDSERRNKSALTFGWTALPAAGRQGPAPELPERGVRIDRFKDGQMWVSQRVELTWPAETEQSWARLWASPQATQWTSEDALASVVRWARLHAALLEDPAPGISAEMRQLEDRLGLSPKALLQLRWRIVTDGASADAPKARRARAAKRSDPRLTVVK